MFSNETDRLRFEGQMRFMEIDFKKIVKELTDSPTQKPAIRPIDPKARINIPISGAYGNNCPCCGVRMEQRLLDKHRAIDRTRAHIFSSRHSQRNTIRDWFYACQRCNLDQGPLSIDEWTLILVYRGDDRAQRVLDLLKILGDMQALPKNATEMFIKAVTIASEIVAADG